MKKKFIAGFLAASLVFESFCGLGTSAIADARDVAYQENVINMASRGSEKNDLRKVASEKNLDASVKTSSTVNTVPEGYTAIRTIDDLCAINNNPQGKYFLANDIDLTEATKKGGSYDTGHGWTPIKCFSGIFEGNGKKIKGMHIYGDEISSAGLFSQLCGGKIKNLAIVDCDIDIERKVIDDKMGRDYSLIAGAIAGESDNDDWYYDYSYYYGKSSIQQCYVTGKIVVNNPSNQYNSYSSGIIGGGECDITNCYSDATLVGRGELSRVHAIGCISEGGITNCYFAGHLECDKKFFGNNMEDCYYLNTCYTTEKFYGTKPLTQTQMRNKGSFTNWDFKNIWYFDSYSDYQYPQLKNAPQVKVSGIEVVTLPKRTSYAQGEKVNLEGTTVKLIYDDGYSTIVDASKDFELKYDNMKVGLQDAILSYGNVTTKIPITFTGEEVTEIEIKAPSTNVANGNIIMLTAITKPENALDNKITWSVTDINGNPVPTTDATISESGAFCGKKMGTYVVTAKTRNGVCKSITISVTKPIIYLIADPEEISMNYGETAVINLTKSPLDSNEEIFWKSSNKSIATVENGKVTALAPGNVTITAYTNSGAQASCKVKIVKNISECNISGVVSQKYTGDEIILEDLQVFDDNGELEEESDYTVRYKNNTKVGTATVIIEGIGNYCGSISKEFEITGKVYAKIPKLSVGKWKKISKKDAKVPKYEIKWKSIKNVDGYEFVESKLNKNNKWSSSTKTTKKSSYVYAASNKNISKIKLKVRAYRYENDKKVYGQWSNSVVTKVEFPKSKKVKSIYFAGEYEHTKYGMSLYMNQYSSPEGKEVGNFKLTPGVHVYLDIKGTLKKVATNKYQCKKGKSVITFKVYQNKVVIGMNKTALKDYYDYRGTYKLKERYYS